MSTKSVGFCFLCVLLLGSTFSSVSAWGGGDKIKLKEVETLTLHQGRLTAGRRSAGVPQLACVGGSAGCAAFVPEVVQCYNRGSDGYDVQWECKTDMPNSFRFGKLEVVCEGYDYPDDPYILKGSCGLEYTIDMTESSRQTGQQYGNPNPDPYYQQSYKAKQSSSGFSDLLVFGGVALVLYALYKTCIAPGHVNDGARSHTNDDFGDPRPPPPPGFRSDFTDNTHHASSGFGKAGPSSSAGAAGTGGGGFWTGAATGGLLGYMLGNRGGNSNQGGYTTGFGGASSNYGFTQPRPSTSSTSWGGTSSSSSAASTSRSASGFGGTRRR